jgi:hypothetical protein
MKSSPLFSFAFVLLSPAFVLLSSACAASGNAPIGDPPKKGGPASQTIPTEPTADAVSFCGSLCSRQESCDTSLDVQTCKNTCTNGFAAVFPKLRQDVVGLIMQCFDAKDCKTVLDGNVIGTCAEEAVASVAPSDEAVGFCDTLSAAKKKCSSSSTKAQCLDQAKLYSDETIVEAANCTDRPCNEIDRCVAATFGELGSAPASPSKPSTNQCTGKFADLGTCQSCAEEECCIEADACAGDSYCRSYMAQCQEASGASYSQCAELLQYNLPATSRQLLGSYYNCAQSKCSTSCGFPQN